MKIKNILGSMVCLALLASCGDEMDYHEYTDYDSKYVFTNFDNTAGFITNIYGFVGRNGFRDHTVRECLHQLVMRLNIPGRTGSVQDFTNGAWSALNAKDN